MLLDESYQASIEGGIVSSDLGKKRKEMMISWNIMEYHGVYLGKGSYAKF